MATFGKYETVAELHRGGLGSLWSARQAGEDIAAPARFAVRTCQPDADIIGSDHAELAVRRFLEASETQRKLSGAGCTHWAPIHEVGKIRGAGGGGGVRGHPPVRRVVGRAPDLAPGEG